MYDDTKRQWDHNTPNTAAATRQRRMHHKRWSATVSVHHPTKQNFSRNMALPQPTDMGTEDWDQEVQRSALLLSSTRIQVYLHLLLNLQEEKKKPRKRKARPRR